MEANGIHLVEDPMRTICGWVTYKAHSCPKCGATIYDEIFGRANKVLSHLTPQGVSCGS